MWSEVIVVLKEQLPHWRLPDQLTSLFDGFFHYSAREPALSAGAVRFIEEIRWFHFSIWESAAVCDELGDIIEIEPLLKSVFSLLVLF